eukprot:8598240-Pyramimonas_sp.AAC.1
MPLQNSSTSVPTHREKERFDLEYFCNPFTDVIPVVDEPSRLPDEWQHAKVDAAVARSASKDEAKMNQDAQAALIN